jgi:hypothetical protein
VTQGRVLAQQCKKKAIGFSLSHKKGKRILKRKENQGL